MFKKPETTILVGLAAAGIVLAIHNNLTPALVDIRVSPPGDLDVQSARRAATWTSVLAVTGVAMVAKDPGVFIIGAPMAIAMDWLTRHANATDPATGRVSGAKTAPAPHTTVV